MKKILPILLLFNFIIAFLSPIKIYASYVYDCLPGEECLSQAPRCGIVTGEEAKCNPECSGLSCCKCSNEEEEIVDKAIYGDYNIDDIVDETINISNKLLGIVGSVALLFFIIAGIKMIFSGGSQEKIGNARTMMFQTIIGLAIFLSAYLIISFVQDTLIENNDYKLNTTEQEFK